MWDEYEYAGEYGTSCRAGVSPQTLDRVAGSRERRTGVSGDGAHRAVGGCGADGKKNKK